PPTCARRRQPSTPRAIKTMPPNSGSNAVCVLIVQPPPDPVPLYSVLWRSTKRLSAESKDGMGPWSGQRTLLCNCQPISRSTHTLKPSPCSTSLSLADGAMIWSGDTASEKCEMDDAGARSGGAYNLTCPLLLEPGSSAATALAVVLLPKGSQ